MRTKRALLAGVAAASGSWASAFVPPVARPGPAPAPPVPIAQDQVPAGPAIDADAVADGSAAIFLSEGNTNLLSNQLDLGKLADLASSQGEAVSDSVKGYWSVGRSKGAEALGSAADSAQTLANSAAASAQVAADSTLAATSAAADKTAAAARQTASQAAQSASDAVSTAAASLPSKEVVVDTAGKAAQAAAQSASDAAAAAVAALPPKEVVVAKAGEAAQVATTAATEAAQSAAAVATQSVQSAADAAAAAVASLPPKEVVAAKAGEAAQAAATAATEAAQSAAVVAKQSAQSAADAAAAAVASLPPKEVVAAKAGEAAQAGATAATEAAQSAAKATADALASLPPKEVVVAKAGEVLDSVLTEEVKAEASRQAWEAFQAANTAANKVSREGDRLGAYVGSNLREGLEGAKLPEADQAGNREKVEGAGKSLRAFPGSFVSGLHRELGKVKTSIARVATTPGAFSFGESRPFFAQSEEGKGYTAVLSEKAAKVVAAVKSSVILVVKATASIQQGLNKENLAKASVEASKLGAVADAQLREWIAAWSKALARIPAGVESVRENTADARAFVARVQAQRATWDAREIGKAVIGGVDSFTRTAITPGTYTGPLSSVKEALRSQFESGFFSQGDAKKVLDTLKGIKEAREQGQRVTQSVDLGVDFSSLPSELGSAGTGLVQGLTKDLGAQLESVDLGSKVKDIGAQLGGVDLGSKVPMDLPSLDLGASGKEVVDRLGKGLDAQFQGTKKFDQMDVHEQIKDLKKTLPQVLSTTPNAALKGVK